MASESKTEFAPRDRWLLFAMVLAPGAWLLHLSISFMLVSETCADGSKLKLHVVTAACMAVALIAAAIGWSIRTACAAEPETALWRQRTKWLATVVVLLSLVMAVVIVAQEIPNLILRSCD